MSPNAGQVRELARSGRLMQVIRWRPLLVTSLGLIVLLAWKISSVGTIDDALTMSRVTTALVAAVAVFALDDVALTLVAAVPLAWSRRLGLRVGIALVWVGVCWLTVLVAIVLRPGVALPLHVVGGLSLECASLAVVGQAVAALSMRWLDVDEPGVAVSAAVVFVAVGLALLPAWGQFYGGADTAWRQAHARWAVLLLVAVTALAASAVDPAVRPFARGR